MNLLKHKKGLLVLSLVFLGSIFYLALYLAKFNFNFSSTILLSEKSFNNYSQIFDQDGTRGVVVYNNDGYDGQYFYINALNNLKTPESFELTLRYQRIIYPALALLLAFGNISYLPFVLILINLAAVVLSSYFLVLILRKYNANLNLIYLWSFNIGMILCLARDLTSPLMFLFLITALYFIENKKMLFASVLFLLAALTRETALTIIIPSLLFFIWKKELKTASILFLSLIFYFAWQLYLYLQFGAWPIFMTGSQISFPLWGFLLHLKNIFSVGNLLSAKFIWEASSLLILVFAFWQLYILFKNKKDNLSFYEFNLIFQIIFVFMIGQTLFIDSIGNLGRYFMPLVLFSILYFASSSIKYPKLLVGINLFLSAIYLAGVLIIFRPDYFLI